MKKKLLSMALATAMVLSLTACGNSDDKAQTNTDSNITKVTQETTQKQETETTTAEKKVEGKLTIYTSQPEADIQALVEAYNKKYPDVTVEIFRSGTEEVISKVQAEKKTGSILADVLLVSDAATFENLKSDNLLMSYESPELTGISSDYYDAEHTYVGTKIISTGIIVNRDMIKDEITGYEDLLKDFAKNNIDMPSPLYSGAAAYNLSVITRTEGMGWEFYEGLKNNGVKVDKGNGTVLNSVLSGEKAIGIIVDYMAIRAKHDGSNVEFVYPKEGSLTVTEPVGIINGTQNEAAAKSFVDFILSEDGQKATASIGYTPIKAGVDAPDGFKRADEITNLTYDLSTLVTERESDKEKFSKLFE